MKERGMMSQQRRLIQLSLVGAIILVLLLGLFLVRRKRVPKPDPAAKVVGHKVETPAEDVQKYWTADKMRNAKPAPMPNVTDLEEGKQRQQRPPKPHA
jgi:hypothetical protein